MAVDIKKYLAEVERKGYERGLRDASMMARTCYENQDEYVIEEKILDLLLVEPKEIKWWEFWK